jgi:hypothetical protein
VQRQLALSHGHDCSPRGVVSPMAGCGTDAEPRRRAKGPAAIPGRPTPFIPFLGLRVRSGVCCVGEGAFPSGPVKWLIPSGIRQRDRPARPAALHRGEPFLSPGAVSHTDAASWHALMPSLPPLDACTGTFRCR